LTVFGSIVFWIFILILMAHSRFVNQFFVEIFVEAASNFNHRLNSCETKKGSIKPFLG